MTTTLALLCMCASIWTTATVEGIALPTYIGRALLARIYLLNKVMRAVDPSIPPLP